MFKENTIESLQRKLIVKLSFFSFCLILSFSAINFALGNVPAGILVFIFSGAFYLSYHLLNSGKQVALALHTLVGGNLIMMSINFFINGGYLGPTNYGFCIQACVFTLILPKKARNFWFSMVLLTYSLLMYLDIFEIVTITNGYNDPLSLYLDHLFVFLACGIFIFYVNGMFTENYVEQSHTLEKTQLALDRNLENLQVSNDIKRNLMGVIAHDLRGPIKSIGQILELYKSEALSPKDTFYLFKSLEQRYRDLDLTLTTTLDFVMSEINGSISANVRQEIDPFSFTEAIINSFEARLEKKNQTIDFKTEQLTDTVTLSFEKNEIEVIIRNLLDNAIKFTPEGLPLTLCLKISGEAISWEISDQGPGIPDKVASELFNIKVNPEKGSNHERGTGIGLYLCKFIANSIDVSLSFVTSSSGGSTFKLEKKVHIPMTGIPQKLEVLDR
ncbi:sensor histidine kinase [Anditalea andensis]|uniref:Histidine kinase domain-containing protein n=1 Tax=Anditalea andensis TaxID=1048983 RepID=A0A074LIY9_9BACT|nr:ATP-binding protein [Anditalea andensis]KEO73767.1 hypothetical protein EL17_09650 [Anditalea andensis]